VAGRDVILDQTIQDIYLLYLTQFNHKDWLELFRKLLGKNSIEVAIMNSTRDLLVSEELIEFLEVYLVR
jgi:hypothetical protein